LRPALTVDGEISYRARSSSSLLETCLQQQQTNQLPSLVELEQEQDPARQDTQRVHGQPSFGLNFRPAVA